MAQASQIPLKLPGDGRFWTDGWDGYPAARSRLFDSLIKHRPGNPVVISGDVHTFYAADLKPDFNLPVSASNPVIATEFCGTSVTSSSRPQAPAKTVVRFQGLDDVARVDTGIATLASFVIRDGRAGVVREDS